MFNMARVLELTLFGGRDPQTGEQLGPADAGAGRDGAASPSWRPPTSSSCAHFVALMVKGCNVVDRIHAEVLPSPFLSPVVDDCIAARHWT